MDFKREKEKFFSRLGECCYMTLATCSDNYPLASTMTCLIFDGAIWMQTDRKFPKYRQIVSNNQVALCLNAVQIEGKAEICGHPLESQNSKFAELMKKYHPESYDMYSRVASEVVIKVLPEKATDWLYEKGDTRIYNFDFLNEKVEISIYENASGK